MKTTFLAYAIALGGIATLLFGVWGVYNLITEEAERRTRDYMSPVQTIALGLVLLGLARALQMLLAVLVTQQLIR